MKKYNTPEMKVSMFDTESVLTSSSTDMATEFDDFYNASETRRLEKSWAELNITF